MKINKQIKKNIDRVIKASFEKGRIQSSKIAKFIKLFKSLPLPQAIASLNLYKKGLTRELAKTTLTVESVIPLSRGNLETIKKDMSKKFTIFETNNVIDKSLLGGLKIKINDVVIEDSIRSRINQVKEALVS